VRVLKCGAREGWRRPVGQVKGVKNIVVGYQTESRKKGKCYME
jgi:hypothetical protein